MHSLSGFEIEEFASRRGAHREDVEYFLCTVGQPSNKEGALMNLYYDARLYGWNISTIRAIEAGIQLAYAEGEVNSEGFYDGISTPLPGGIYSHWPFSKNV